SVLYVRAAHRRAVEHGVGKGFELAPEEMTVGAERPAIGRVLLVEDLDVARSEIPGIVGLRHDAAILAIELQALVPIHAHGDGEIEMAERAVGEARLDEPAIGAELLYEARLDLRYLAAEIARRVDEMAAMGEHEVAPEIRLRIAWRLRRLPARHGE